MKIVLAQPCAWACNSQQFGACVKTGRRYGSAKLVSLVFNFDSPSSGGSPRRSPYPTFSPRRVSCSLSAGSWQHANASSHGSATTLLWLIPSEIAIPEWQLQRLLKRNPDCGEMAAASSSLSEHIRSCDAAVSIAPSSQTWRKLGASTQRTRAGLNGRCAIRKGQPLNATWT